MILSIAHFVEMLKVKRYSQSTVNSYRSALLLVKRRFKMSLKNISESELHQFIYDYNHQNSI